MMLLMSSLLKNTFWHRSRYLIFFALFAFLLIPILNAQEPVPIGQKRLIVKGVVKDKENSPLSGVAISFFDIESQSSISLITDANGQFQYSGLKPGRYRVTVSLPGFTKIEKEVIASPNSAMTLNVSSDSTITLDFLPPDPIPAGSRISGGQPSSNAAEIFKLTFSTDAELQKWLNEQKQKKNVLVGIVPLKECESLFILKPGLEESCVSFLVDSALSLESLKERINLYRDKTYIGIHILSSNSYLIILREKK